MCRCEVLTARVQRRLGGRAEEIGRARGGDWIFGARGGDLAEKGALGVAAAGGE